VVPTEPDVGKPPAGTGGQPPAVTPPLSAKDRLSRTNALRKKEQQQKEQEKKQKESQGGEKKDSNGNKKQAQREGSIESQTTVESIK
jgi:hypothetical protein